MAGVGFVPHCALPSTGAGLAGRRPKAYSRRSPRRHTLRCQYEVPRWAQIASRDHDGNVVPHAGSYFARRDEAGRRRSRFFEGWFLRLVLNDAQSSSFAMMFSIEDFRAPHERQVIAQVLGPDERLLVKRFDGGDENWFASADVFSIGNVENSTCDTDVKRPLSPSVFEKTVTSGFQLAFSNCCGRFDAKDRETDESHAVEWRVEMLPLLSWGPRGYQGRSVARWLGHLPVFEPGYQVSAYASAKRIAPARGVTCGLQALHLCCLPMMLCAMRDMFYVLVW